MAAREGVMATEIRLWAERRAGELLAEMAKHPGARGTGKKVPSSGNDSTPTLKALGITRDQSSTCDFARRLTVEDLLP